MILEESPLKVENGPTRMTEWLDFNYEEGRASKDIYVIALKLWINCTYEVTLGPYIRHKYGIDRELIRRDSIRRIRDIEAGIERYLGDLNERNFTIDYRGYIRWLRAEKYANLTIKAYAHKVKRFFDDQDPRCKIDKKNWKQIQRTILPRTKRGATQDEILTREQLKEVFRYATPHGKALAFFLLSTGARIGESCKLKMGDLHLHDDPPWVHIKEEYTKDEVGGRIMWFSYETREAIINWHKIRETYKKKGAGNGELFDKEFVFNYDKRAFTKVWNNFLRIADKNERGKDEPPVLARRDTSTKKNVHVYHVHTLRKRFRTNMGLEGSYEDKAGIPDMIVHGWMGHSAYLSQSYDKLGLGRMSDIYKDNMHVVTIHEVGIDEQAKARYEAVANKAAMVPKLQEQTKWDKEFVNYIGRRLGVFVGMTDEQKKALTQEDRKELIIDKIVELERKRTSLGRMKLKDVEDALDLIKSTITE